MKLITWNIQWCRGVDGRVDPDRIVAHARAVADFDVLCLQEVAANFPALPGSGGENQFELIAQRLPEFAAIPGAAVDTRAPDGGRRAFGNLILSRFPVEQVLRWQLPWPCDPQARRSMPRVLLETTIDSPIGLLRVQTTHLEYYSPEQRAAQVRAIRARHAEACTHARTGSQAGSQDPDSQDPDSQDPFRTAAHCTSAILTGDFNFRPDDPLHMELRERFADGAPELIDAWQQLHPGVQHAYTNGVHDRKQWPAPYTCDYIFVSSDLAPRLRALTVDADTRASDHQPVLLELE